MSWIAIRRVDTRQLFAQFLPVGGKMEVQWAPAAPEEAMSVAIFRSIEVAQPVGDMLAERGFDVVFVPVTVGG